jgi:hypothetical protein
VGTQGDVNPQSDCEQSAGAGTSGVAGSQFARSASEINEQFESCLYAIVQALQN